MPIYEYVCRGCENEFEAWLRKESEIPTCPSCKGVDLEKKLSLPRVHGEGSREKAMRAAKKRDSAQAKESTYTQEQYEANHDD
ncbi:MAG: zinc ribbon domain-containing protein [Gemmatimonadetes bacterium]|jgi:putative FmdB family regulatory protein|nr:zinc ribbon domain-containing protein [Gemmatimonadota bacterium]